MYFFSIVNTQNIIEYFLRPGFTFDLTCYQLICKPSVYHKYTYLYVLSFIAKDVYKR